MDEAQPKAQAAPAPKKKGGLLKKILLVVVLLVAAGGGGAWWMLRAESPKAEPGPETRGLVPFEPFLVNLTGSDGTQFLKVNLQLVVESAHAATDIEETPVMLMQVRSAILELLTEQIDTLSQAVLSPEDLGDDPGDDPGSRLS